MLGSENLTAEELQHLEAFGEIDAIDDFPNLPYAFVKFCSPEDAQSCIGKPMTIKGEKIRIEAYTSRYYNGGGRSRSRSSSRRDRRRPSPRGRGSRSSRSGSRLSDRSRRGRRSRSGSRRRRVVEAEPERRRRQSASPVAGTSAAAWSRGRQQQHVDQHRKRLGAVDPRKIVVSASAQNAAPGTTRRGARVSRSGGGGRERRPRGPRPSAPTTRDDIGPTTTQRPPRGPRQSAPTTRDDDDVMVLTTTPAKKPDAQNIEVIDVSSDEEAEFCRKEDWDDWDEFWRREDAKLVGDSAARPATVKKEAEEACGCASSSAPVSAGSVPLEGDRGGCKTEPFVGRPSASDVSSISSTAEKFASSEHDRSPPPPPQQRTSDAEEKCSAAADDGGLGGAINTFLAEMRNGGTVSPRRRSPAANPASASPKSQSYSSISSSPFSPTSSDEKEVKSGPVQGKLETAAVASAASNDDDFEMSSVDDDEQQELRKTAPLDMLSCRTQSNVFTPTAAGSAVDEKVGDAVDASASEAATESAMKRDDDRAGDVELSVSSEGEKPARVASRSSSDFTMSSMDEDERERLRKGTPIDGGGAVGSEATMLSAKDLPAAVSARPSAAVLRLSTAEYGLLSAFLRPASRPGFLPAGDDDGLRKAVIAVIAALRRNDVALADVQRRHQKAVLETHDESGAQALMGSVGAALESEAHALTIGEPIGWLKAIFHYFASLYDH